MNISPDRVMSVFVSLDDIFPELRDDYETLRSLLDGIDRSSALVNCAQIGLVLADPKTDGDERQLSPEERDLRRQQQLVQLFFNQAEADRLSEFAARHRPVQPIVFFREQVLELIRWVMLICRDEPGHELGGADREELNRRFTKALLIASGFWSRRVYRSDLSAARGRPRDEVLEIALRAFRSAATFRADPMTALARGRRLLRKMCEIDPSFEQLFTMNTQLCIDDYLLGVFVILGFTLGHASRGGLSGIFDLRQLRAETRAAEDALDRFLSIAAQSARALRTALWQDRSQPTEADYLDFDLHPIMEKPILLLPEEKAIVVDAAFCDDCCAPARFRRPAAPPVGWWLLRLIQAEPGHVLAGSDARLFGFGS